MNSRNRPPSKAILAVAPESVVETTRRMLLEDAGYQVVSASTADEAERLLGEESFSVVTFGAGLATAEAIALARVVRERSPHTRLIATGLQQMRAAVDGFLEAQESPDVFLRMVGSLLMQAHGHPEVSGDYVAYVDAERRYISLTKGFCELLGYPQEDLLGMNIEQVTFPESANVPDQFKRFKAEGHQQGRFLLRHRNGHPVPVHFEARVLDDGCMVSVLTPATNVGKESQSEELSQTG